MKKNSRDIIQIIVGGTTRVRTFTKCICPKVNVVAWLDIELVYNNVTVT